MMKQRLQVPDGEITLSYEYLGAPCIKFNGQFFPLVPFGHSFSSKLRIKSGLALSKYVAFNFNRVLVQPYWQGDSIVFPRFNGETMFILETAGEK